MDIPDEIKCSERSPERNLTPETELIIKMIWKLTGNSTPFCFSCGGLNVNADILYQTYDCQDCGEKTRLIDLCRHYPVKILI